MFRNWQGSATSAEPQFMSTLDFWNHKNTPYPLHMGVGLCYNLLNNLNLMKRSCNMGKSKKNKNYDIYISPGKWYLFKTRRILFVLSVMFFILNMSIIAGFDESMRKTAIISIVLSTLFGIVQFVDNRKVHWDWPYIIVLCAMFLLFAAFSAFSTELIFMRYIWLGELFFFCVFVILLLRKKKC